MCEPRQLDIREMMNRLRDDFLTPPRAALLGNIGDRLTADKEDPLTATDFIMPTIEMTHKDYAASGLTQDELASIGIGKPRKKSFAERYHLSQEQKIIDAKGWELLQTGADAEKALDVLTTLQSLMEDGKIVRFGGLAGCRVRPLHQLEKNSDGTSEKVIGYDGKPVLAPPSIHRYECGGEVSHHMTGLQLCSSPMKCPVCARIITWLRRIQIAWGVWLLIEDGKTYVMATLTAPHGKDTDPVEFVSAFCRARKVFMSCARWKKIMKKYNYFGVISGNEITVDAPWATNKTGMHYHSHCLLFFDRQQFNEEEIKEITCELATAWTESCEKEKLVTPATRAAHMKHGFDLAQREDSDSSESGYKAADYIAKEVSFEVAAAPGSKTARRPDRLNQWQLMLLATSTHPHLIPELERVLLALNGRRLTYWTKNIQQHYGVPTAAQIKQAVKGGDIEEILEENIVIAQQICGEIPDLIVPVTLEAAQTESVLETAENMLEDAENIDENEESMENEEITKGEAGEEVLQISFIDHAYISYYGAQYKLLKSIPIRDENGETYTLEDAAEYAKISIQLISRGIDPVTFKKMKSKRSDISFRISMSRANENEKRRKKAGYEIPVSWSSQPLLFDMEDVIP